MRTSFPRWKPLAGVAAALTWMPRGGLQQRSLNSLCKRLKNAEQGQKKVRSSWLRTLCVGFPAEVTSCRGYVGHLRVHRALKKASMELPMEDAGSSEESLVLDGRHEFPFSFQLPQEPLVTSFTGKYGSIQYYVRAILERPAAPDQSVQTELQVISHIDVSSPALLTPVLRSQEKMVGCWFFTSGPVSLSAKIERKGYCNGEAIPIYAEIENCSSRLIVPKAAIFQTQTYLASGKTKTFRQMVANVRGNHIASGSTDTWNGKTLKIPPVSPSILDCCIIRVEYSLAVYIHIPGAKKLMIEMPLVIGTIPCIGFSSRNSSITSQFSMDMSWLALTMPEHPEAPPNYADVVSEEEFSRHVPAYPPPIDCEEQLCCPVFAYIQEFRFQPPPLYSEIDPHPTDVEEIQPISFML
ncbi:PREDICTED: arrestin domain-containing protein 4 [Apaloderma vittatum]|uniref:arrestin domain-containing protein 4 n=1 Tax=Apaloderma vittatum TaxID=57397 RepID=UPI000521B052|nr:PREDICTED: arrestin domain-containing protein 4 [Apaloderma vittatum]